MIFTLVGANFKDANIGTLNTWLILRKLGAGTTYTGPAYVDKDAPFSATITLAEGYDLASAGVSVLMGGNVVTTGISVKNSVISIAINKVTGSIVIKVPTINVELGEGGGSTVPDSGSNPGGNSYNDASMWMSQTISSTGTISTTGITQSNIMAKSKFIGSATFTALDQALTICLVQYDDNGSFKSRGSWQSLTKNNSITFTDANPFNVIIATSATNTSLTVEQMVSMLNVVGNSVDSMSTTIYSLSPDYWIRQSLNASGAIIPVTDATYNRSNIMGAQRFTEKIQITAKQEKLMTSKVVYDASGQFVSRGAWDNIAVNNSITYSDTNPFNVIIATNNESTYTLNEMLALIDVRGIA